MGVKNLQNRGFSGTIPGSLGKISNIPEIFGRNQIKDYRICKQDKSIGITCFEYGIDTNISLMELKFVFWTQLSFGLCQMRSCKQVRCE